MIAPHLHHNPPKILARVFLSVPNLDVLRRLGRLNALLLSSFGRGVREVGDGA